MSGWTPDGAAGWLAEALESGNPLGPLPEGLAPPDLGAAEALAAATLDALGIVPCGLRLFHHQGQVITGPMIEARLLPQGATVALGALRHPLVTAAVIGVLGAALHEAEDQPPVLAHLHPAIDISASRFTDAPADPRLLTADLGRLGLVVAGKGKALQPGRLPVGLGAKGARPRRAPVDLAALLHEAARAARRWGGLPAGALLVVAGLTAPVAPAGTLRAGFGALGAAEATFA